jgi:hypothetical protein
VNKSTYFFSVNRKKVCMQIVVEAFSVYAILGQGQPCCILPNLIYDPKEKTYTYCSPHKSSISWLPLCVKRKEVNYDWL